MKDLLITKKLQCLFEQASKSLNNRKTIFPIDIFITMILDNSGSLKELNTKFYKYIYDLQNISHKIKDPHLKDKHTFLNYEISNSTLEIINIAIKIMHLNNQLYLNELFFINALALNNNEVTTYLNKKDLNFLLKLSTYSKDLIVFLDKTLAPPLPSLDNTFIIKKALSKDKYILYDFIKENFNSIWADTLLPSFSFNNIPIFIAFFKDSVIGFSAYDIFGSGTFGPMGVLKGFRNNSIGKALLSFTLYEMKSQGYVKVIIKNAGPIEFYEKCCNAQII